MLSQFYVMCVCLYKNMGRGVGSGNSHYKSNGENIVSDVTQHFRTPSQTLKRPQTQTVLVNCQCHYTVYWEIELE